jgi:hypothetical protein
LRIFVKLTTAEAERLSALAQRERRHPKDQAALLILRGLELVADPPASKLSDQAREAGR